MARSPVAERIAHGALEGVEEEDRLDPLKTQRRLWDLPLSLSRGSLLPKAGETTRFARFAPAVPTLALLPGFSKQCREKTMTELPDERDPDASNGPVPL